MDLDSTAEDLHISKMEEDTEKAGKETLTRIKKVTSPSSSSPSNACKKTKALKCYLVRI